MPTDLTGRSPLRAALLPAALTAISAASSWWAAGLSLGLFFASIALITTLLPSLILSESTLKHRLAIAAGAIAGTAFVWLFTILKGVSLTQWLECSTVLAAYACALCGATILLHRLGIEKNSAAAIVVILGLAWLAWPIWLSTWISERTAALLVSTHPLLVVNGIFEDKLGLWTEGGLLYHLTGLGQDLAYRLPTSPLLLLIAHLLPALLILLPPATRPADAPSDR